MGPLVGIEIRLSINRELQFIKSYYFDAWPETMEETFGEVIENLTIR
jgi:hypothetical protein